GIARARIAVRVIPSVGVVGIARLVVVVTTIVAAMTVIAIVAPTAAVVAVGSGRVGVSVKQRFVDNFDTSGEYVFNASRLISRSGDTHFCGSSVFYAECINGDA